MVTLGDSLTFAYEAEFGFQLDLWLVSYADVFTPTLWLLDQDPPYIHGITLENPGSPTGTPRPRLAQRTDQC